MICGPAPLPQTSLRTVYPPLDQVAHLSEDDHVAAVATPAEATTEAATVKETMRERTALCMGMSSTGEGITSTMTVPLPPGQAIREVRKRKGLSRWTGKPLSTPSTQEAARRFVQMSYATAASSTTPFTSITRSLGAPIRDMPLLITAMIRPPVIAPTTLPTPPWTAAPPMNAAAIESSSKLVRAVGPACWSRPAKMTPATAARTPMLTNSQNTTDLVLTPDRVAACRLPPTA